MLKRAVILVMVGAVLLPSTIGCTATGRGAAAGAALGGAAGYIIGKNTGDGGGRRATRAALIGAAAGTALGALIGREIGKVKYCPQCGTSYQEEDSFCVHDGTQLSYKR